MPKELTHWILAERALKALSPNSSLAGLLSDHHQAYLGGAVLPDTLMHLFRGIHSPTALGLTDDFHDSRGNSFAPLIRIEERYGGSLPPPLLACLLGVLSHIMSDMLFHPYVFALTGLGDIGRHYRLETALDVHFLRRGSIPPVRRMTRLVTPETAPLLAESMALLFDPEGRLPRTALEQALALHCRIQGMYDSLPWKIVAMILARLPRSPFRAQRQLFYPIRSMDQGLLGMIDDITVWSHPVTGGASDASPDDLAEQAVDRTVELFRRIEASGSLAAVLGDPPGANLLTGLHGIGKNGMGTTRSNRSMA